MKTVPRLFLDAKFNKEFSNLLDQLKLTDPSKPAYDVLELAIIKLARTKAYKAYDLGVKAHDYK